jgi:hypothetical protein
MSQNPYESPHEPGYEKTPRPPRRRKPLWMYPIAAVIGGIAGAIILTPFLADLDDAGGLELLVGAFLGVVIYGLLF